MKSFLLNAMRSLMVNTGETACFTIKKRENMKQTRQTVHKMIKSIFIWQTTKIRCKIKKRRGRWIRPGKLKKIWLMNFNDGKRKDWNWLEFRLRMCRNFFSTRSTNQYIDYVSINNYSFTLNTIFVYWNKNFCHFIWIFSNNKIKFSKANEFSNL